MARMSISRTGLELIESFEGFRARAARLPGGTYTIGFGHTQFAREGIVIDRLEAEDLLRWDLRPVEDAVRQNVHAPITQNQFDALVSLAFNIGTGNFLKSEVLTHINAGEPIAAATAMGAWRCAVLNGTNTIVDALVRRRAAEAALFLEPDGNRPPAPTPVVVPTNDNFARRVAANDRVVATDGNGMVVPAPFPAMGQARQKPMAEDQSAAPAVYATVADDEPVAPEAPSEFTDLAPEPAEEPAPEASTLGSATAQAVEPELAPANDGPVQQRISSAAVRAHIERNLQSFPAAGELNFEAPPESPQAANASSPLTRLPANDATFGKKAAPSEMPAATVKAKQKTTYASESAEVSPGSSTMITYGLTGLGGVMMVAGLWRAITEGLLNRAADAAPLSALESVPLLSVAVGFVMLVVGLIGLASSNAED